MASVFLSYSREDVERVRPLAAALEKAGHEVWWDRHISGGEEFAGAIEEALEAADAVVVAWTATSVKSAWVRDEAAAGRDSGRLVPVTLDGCQAPLGFRQYQTIDLSTWSGRSGSRTLRPLIAAIEARAKGPAVKRARPTERVGDWKRRWAGLPRAGALAAALALLILVAGGFLYSRSAGRVGIEPKVQLGEFKAVSPGLPGELAHVIGQEVLAAFGAENAVAVVTAGAGRSAPFVMDGSVSKLGQSVRYTMSLKNLRSGVVVWSEGYERDSGDALAARQVAVQASQVVRCGLWGASSYKRRMSDQALSLYLQWCNEHWSGSGSVSAELDSARKVTSAVPDFSFGWSARALAAVPLALEAGSADAEQLAREAADAARRSIALDDQNPEGYMALAVLLPLDRYTEREQLLRKAISVRKTECGCERLAYGDFLVTVGRIEEASEQYERARAMMPLAPFSNLKLAQGMYMVGRHQEADRILSDTLELWPQASDLHLLKVKSAFWTGRHDEALSVLRSPELRLASVQRDALVATFEALKTASGTRRSQALALLGHCVGDPRRTDRLIVGALAALDEDGAALDAARQLVANRGHMHADVLFEPNLAKASGSPSYAALLNRLGLTGYWRQSRQAPDICRGSARPSYCSVA